MSSEFQGENSQAAKFPLSRIALFGGGRWSRVLLPIIQSLLTDDAELIWVTEHGFERAKEWLHEKAIKRVKVVSQIDLASETLDAAIVATSPAAHSKQVRSLLKSRVPVFCEKPFTLDLAEATELEWIASAQQVPLGVNLELHYASFLEEFAAVVTGRVVKRIAIDWFDPWTDERYGETKYGDVYTSIVDDMWPHCWSLLRRLCPGQRIEAIENVGYQRNDGRVAIEGRMQRVGLRVALSRRGERRVRRIEINDGELVLDFSAEPGWTKVGDEIVQNQWRGARPLNRSLSSFFSMVTKTSECASWPLAVSNCLDSVRFASEISERLKATQETQLAELLHSRIDANDTSLRNLVVDLMLPRFAMNGQRWPAISIEDQNAFVRHFLHTQVSGR